MALSEKEIKKLYKKVEEHYTAAGKMGKTGTVATKIQDGHEFREEFAKRIVNEHIIPKVKKGEEFTFLDVGSGSGGALYDSVKRMLAEALKSENLKPSKPIRYIFVDFSEGQIERLRNKIKEEAEDENAITPIPKLGDIRNLSEVVKEYRGGVDFVFAGEVFCHLFTPEDREKALRQLAEVVKQGEGFPEEDGPVDEGGHRERMADMRGHKKQDGGAGNLEIILMTDSPWKEPDLLITMTDFPLLEISSEEIEKAGKKAGFKHTETKTTPPYNDYYVLKFKRKPRQRDTSREPRGRRFS